MSKPIRILTAILASLAIGGMFAYQDAQKNEPPYQQHPVVCIATDFFGGSLSGLIFYFGSGWLAKRKERKLKQLENDKYYDEVARELQDKPMVPGLWTKAYAEMGGDDAKARALYIKYRVAQLSEASHQQLDEAQLAKHQQEKQRRDAIETAKRQARSTSHRVAHTFLFIICFLLVLLFGLTGVCVIFLPFTEGSNAGDSLAGEIGGAIFSLLIAFCFGLATKHCYKEMQ